MPCGLHPHSKQGGPETIDRDTWFSPIEIQKQGLHSAVLEIAQVSEAESILVAPKVPESLSLLQFGGIGSVLFDRWCDGSQDFRLGLFGTTIAGGLSKMSDILFFCSGSCIRQGLRVWLGWCGLQDMPSATQGTVSADRMASQFFLQCAEGAAKKLWWLAKASLICSFLAHGSALPACKMGSHGQCDRIPSFRIESRDERHTMSTEAGSPFC